MPVTTHHPQYDEHLPEWEMMEQALSGERAVKEDAGNLPKPSGMVEAERQAKEKGGESADYLYQNYTDRAQYQHWVKDGIRAMVGLVSRLQPEISLPPAIASMEANATTDGFSLRQLFMRVVRETLGYGRIALLADVDDAADSFIALYSAQSAINWKQDNREGRDDLVMAVLAERRVDGAADEFSHDSKPVYRVLDMAEGHYRVRLLDEAGEVVGDEQRPGLRDSQGGLVRGLDYLPLVFCGSIDNAPGVNEAPLLTMAKAAKKDYQLSADYFTALHQTSHPQPWVAADFGEDDDLSVTGPSAAWMLPTGGSCGYLEFQGAGIEAVRKAMNDQKNAALEAGARVMDVGSNESGEARKTRQNDQHATLHSVVITAAEAIEQALRYAAEWKGADPATVTFTVKPDFNTAEIDPQVLAQIQAAVIARGVSWETYWQYLTTGKLPEHGYNEEAPRIENPGGTDDSDEGEEDGE